MEDVSWPGQWLAGDHHNAVMHFEGQALVSLKKDGKYWWRWSDSSSSAKGATNVG
jgi:hypothetical protein